MNCLVKQFAICLGVVVILLVNVMELFGVVGSALLDRPCMVFTYTVVISAEDVCCSVVWLMTSAISVRVPESGVCVYISRED